ncbi:MAG: PAS domain-containing sensor histidine kinase [Burkholderiales bacterium]
MDVAKLLHLTAIQTTEQGILLLEPTGVIGWCNEAVARIFGYTRERMIGLDVRSLFTPEDVRAGVHDFELAVASNSTDMQDDRWMLRADGSRFWAAGSTTALRSESGELMGFGKIVRDVSNVKEQLETLRNRSEALLRADEHKNIFLSTLSHELRNPLAPLANALQLITLAAPDNAQLQYPIKLIERQVGFIRRLVDDLLDVTRISTGKIELQLRSTDVREIVMRAIESTRPIIVQKNHRLEQHLLAAPILVNADTERLEQVFVNLLQNAAKYTPTGGTIDVRVSMEQNEATVHVADNGIGIAKEMQPRIFQLFTQVADAAHRSEGLGIGLSLVKNLVELHGGSVQVRSEGPGTGSEFTVRLPLARPRA